MIKCLESALILSGILLRALFEDIFSKKSCCVAIEACFLSRLTSGTHLLIDNQIYKFACILSTALS